MSLQGTLIHLRALEPEDIDFLYAIENDRNVWRVSHTQTPFSKYLLQQYLDNSHLDIYQAKQLRLVIAKNNDSRPVGMIDLFDFDPANCRAGIGIVVTDEGRANGFGSEALTLLIPYAFEILNLHQLYANIGTENLPSLKLFSKFGFREAGIKKEWNRDGGKYLDEALYQLINPQSGTGETARDF